MRALVAEHPDPEALARQYAVLDRDLPVHRGDRAALVAELDTLNGPVTLR